MQIECILKRKGGTQVDLGGVKYDFQPNDDGAHVATVEADEHIERFLAIPEGYKIHRGAAPVQTASSPAALLGSSVHEATYEIGGKTVQLGLVVAKAHEKSGLTVEEWNAIEEEDRHARIDVVLDHLADAAEKPATKKAAQKGGK